MIRFSFLFLSSLLILLSIDGCQPSDTTDATIDKSAIEDSESMVDISSPVGQITLAGYGFPLTVDEVIKDLGPPDHTFVDKNEYCSVGQLHSWCSLEKNQKLSVLGDSYNDKVDYSAESRLLSIEKCDPNRSSDFEGLLGIHLGDPGKDVKKKLDSYVEQNIGFIVSKSDSGSPIHAFIGERHSFKHQHILEKDEMYYFFLINKEDRLEAIIKSSFNVLSTC